jgi:tRNA pseudouridine13 synthase
MTEGWPTLLCPPVFKGVIRSTPDDFVVEEIPAYLPCGSGSHLFLQIRKRDLNTADVVRALSRHLKLPPFEIGVAGLKDKKAVTTQWFSIPRTADHLLSSFHLDGAEIQNTALHVNKLKTGHLKGNRFEIKIKNLPPQALDDILGRCEKLKSLGVPNYFGEQRFGKDNDRSGFEILRGAPPPRDGRRLRFLLSAAQSALFNNVLAERIRRDLFSKVLMGDVLVKSDTGGIFLCTDPAADQQRMNSFLVHPTGPLFGPKMKKADFEPAKMEEAVLLETGLLAQAFERYKKLTQGTRRSLRLSVCDLELSSLPDALLLRFSLPSGSYATTVLRELVDVSLANGFFPLPADESVD